MYALYKGTDNQLGRGWAQETASLLKLGIVQQQGHRAHVPAEYIDAQGKTAARTRLLVLDFLFLKLIQLYSESDNEDKFHKQ